MLSIYRKWISIGSLVAANLLIPVAILTFASGFFPHKAFLPGHSRSYDGDHDYVPGARFDKVIFMVVDALRSDFVYSKASAFAFVQGLIRSGEAIPFTAHATSPTITMPRVKAMTTGSVPSFLDVILNFAESDTSSTLAHQDTWPRQLAAKPGAKLVMYGDDTWLKLFPGLFARADGTSSFFVSDFTEVDNNVTRHVPSELESSDWNGMVMHYLGLDHIGHKSGPKSPHMVPKQKEMDDIVRQIYDAIISKSHLESTILVLCGDHGMNDAGNHGGSGAGETSPALVFVSPKLKHIGTGANCPSSEPEDRFHYYNMIEQSDIVPTLSGLLGLPIPMNNLGVFIPQFLALWPVEHQVWILQNNVEQILRVLRASFGEILFGESPSSAACEEGSQTPEKYLACQWFSVHKLLASSTNDPRHTIGELQEFLRNAQAVMSSAATNYDVTKLHVGIALAIISASFAFFASTLQSNTHRTMSPWGYILAACYGMIMFASSYVEEEQRFWYWVSSGWIIWLHIATYGDGRASGILTTMLLLVLRIGQRWNQTGQKHAGSPDIGRTWLSAHTTTLWLLVFTTYLIFGRRVGINGLWHLPKFFSVLSTSSVCILSCLFRITFTDADAPELLENFSDTALEILRAVPLVTQARVVFLGISILGTYIIYRARTDRSVHRSLAFVSALHDLSTIFLITQTRPNNIPLYLLFHIQLQLLQHLNLRMDELALTSLIFQYTSFFVFGGSNAISSIDLSNAYNGVDGYNILVVGVLTFLNNWCGPVWWAFGTNLLFLRKRQAARDTVIDPLVLFTFFTSTSLVFVMLACTLLRAHLFIWTVFAPKYLFSMAWSMGQHVCINIILGGAFLVRWSGNSVNR